VSADPVLYLIPNFIGEVEPGRVFPPYNIEVVRQLRYYIAEREKTVRAFIKRVAPGVPQSELHFFVLNKHTTARERQGFLAPLRSGHSMGLVSEAGMPAVADPGAAVVLQAHQEGFRVEPLVGPSSVLLALAASGLNGQKFVFHGYLPVDSKDLVRQIRRLEQRSRQGNETQIFIETPYRNNKMLQHLLRTLSPSTHLCIATGLTTPQQWIRTMPVAMWKEAELPDLHKKPTVFLFLASGGF